MRRILSISLFAALPLLAPHAAGQCSTTENRQLTASDGVAGDHFGQAVWLAGNTAVVGAPLHNTIFPDAGEAYVYQRGAGGVGNWGQVKRLVAPGAGDSDLFGSSVALDGDFLVAGSPMDDDAGPESGSAQLFGRDVGGAGFWGHIKQLTASDGAMGDLFGTSMALAGDTLIVGAPGRDGLGTDLGGGYVFQRDEGGPDNWGGVRILTALDGTLSDFLGTSAAISGDTIVLGSPNQDGAASEAGAVYVFERDLGGANAWAQSKKIVASNAAIDDEFGISVALDGDTLVVGAHRADGAGVDAGAVYIFERNQGGPENWGEAAILAASDPEPGALYGASVAISGDVVIAGAPFALHAGVQTGAAYEHRRDYGGVAGSWRESRKLLSSSGAAGDEQGSAVSVDGATALVAGLSSDVRALDAGAAHVYAVPAEIGVIYCTPNIANTTGDPASIHALGSDVVAANDLVLAVTELPPNQFGYFLSSSLQGFIAMPGGSVGNFCLGGGATLGRFNNMTQNSGASGIFCIRVDLTMVPVAMANPGTVALMPGDTWRFQCWYRDGNQSNFSDGIEILFQ